MRSKSLSGQRLTMVHSWRIAEISYVLGSESLKKINSQKLFEGVSRKIILAHLQHIQLSDITGTAQSVKLHEKFCTITNPLIITSN